MQKKLNKILLSALAAILVLLGILFYDDASSVVTDDPSQNEILKVHFLDVGQGDAIFIQTPYEQNILIDGGPDAQVVYELGKVMPFYDRDIDVMILTHPHNDHVSGLIDVLQKYNVKEVYYSGAVHTTPQYIEWLELIRDKDIKLLIVKKPIELELGEGLTMQFLYPTEDLTNIRAEELNNTSIVSKLIYKDVSFLFMGDAETEVEEQLLEKDFDIKADILKVGHHGSTSSSSEEFLEKVNPDVAVIQCGPDNSFGHPHARVLKRLERVEAQVYRNDRDGRVTITSDGVGFEVVER